MQRMSEIGCFCKNLRLNRQAVPFLAPPLPEQPEPVAQAVVLAWRVEPAPAWLVALALGLAAVLSSQQSEPCDEQFGREMSKRLKNSPWAPSISPLKGQPKPVKKPKQSLFPSASWDPQRWRCQNCRRKPCKCAVVQIDTHRFYYVTLRSRTLLAVVGVGWPWLTGARSEVEGCHVSGRKAL